MAKLWADRIRRGKNTVDDVPVKLRDAVEELLKGEGDHESN